MRWLFLLLVFGQAMAQETYRFRHDIEAATARDTTPWRLQMAATAYSLSGHYGEGLIQWDLAMPATFNLSASDSLALKTMQAVPAVDAILQLAREKNIVMINEAHHDARHRDLTRTLLQGLRQQGFETLALEALADTLVNARGFAIKESGYYTQEPQFGNLIHEAIKLGFRVVGYEAPAGVNGKDREIAQAANLKKILERYPGKLLVHCGYDHVIEGTPNNPSWERAMAGRLKDLTGMDPLTIDQVRHAARGNIESSHPFARASASAGSWTLMDRNGKYWSSRPDQYDLSIVHPHLIDIEGRPHWMVPGRSEHFPKTDRKQNALVLAYRKDEFEKGGIPADIVEHSATKQPCLRLFPGAYEIVILDPMYRIVKKYKTTVR